MTKDEKDLNMVNDQQKSEDKLEALPTKVEQVGFFKLFRFATGYDKLLMFLGGFAAMANGASLPLFSLVFGEMIDAFGPEYTRQKVVDNALVQAYWFLGVGAGSFICSWIQMQTWIMSGERQAISCRKQYFKALLEQDISWFDQINPNQLATKVATETFAIQGAIGEKVPTFIMTISMLIFGFLVAFIRGWELSLICTAALPFIALASGIFTHQLQTSENNITNSFRMAGGKAEQAISGIKTVKSLNGQTHEQNNFMVYLQRAYKLALKYGIYVGASLGFVWFVMLADYGLGFWFGSIFVGDKTENALYDRPYSGGDVIVIFFSIMMGGFSLGQATPCLKNFALGQQAGFQVFKVLDAKPKISPSLLTGQKLENLKGNITFRNVEFTYPQKPDVQVLKSINLNIQAGKKTALVGESGSGKSTTLQLLERFYDCDKGQVFVDGTDIKELNLQWFRENVGYVGQEPALFATSIRENLRFGKSDATEAQMISALKQANAYEFVMHLEDKLDTFVGSSGSQLSGGQKQRLSIARAILKNPPILLLDEATSALDRKNEKEIQKTLDEISKNRTTIVIAHRLTTVQNSDNIIVIDRGLVVEEGNHQTLMNKQGKYAALCQNQIAQEQEEQQQQENSDSQEEIQQIELVKGVSEVHNKHNRLSLKQIEKNASQVPGEAAAEDVKVEEKQLTKEEKKALALQEKKQKDAIMKKLYKFNAPEKPWMWIGGFFSFVGGCSFPLCALIMAKMMDVLARVDFMDEDEFRDESNKWCAWFLYISLITFFAMVFQFACWNKVAQSLTLKLRKETFEKITNMRVSWFDESENNAGTLTARLGSDTQLVNGLTSTVVNLQISNASAFLSGLTIAFIHDWRTTLVGLVTFPLIFIAGGIQAQFMQGFSELTDAGYKDSGNLVQEAVCNIRTVCSFGNEKTILESYSSRLAGPLALLGSKGFKAGMAFGFSQFAMFLVYAILFYIGAVFHRDADVDSVDMFTAVFALMYAAFGSGNNNQFMTDVGAAMNAAKNLFKVLDAKDELQLHNEANSTQFKGERIQGNIEFKNVNFSYPSRDKLILNNVSFKIEAGQKVAFVGPSGCGKSTIMQLLMRFYEITGGQILIDGRDIQDYDIFFLRSQFGVVSQEPILFAGTIEENIRYNTQNVTLENIKDAAKQANATEFIEKNQSDNNAEGMQMLDAEGNKIDVGTGYQRQVGNKGSQLSGGQKQRIAIARAIIKKPNILLLDEATSALDSRNEKVVQDSLDQIMQSKTTLAIAHRISTIKDSDQIIVIEEGHLVEKGNYQQLQQNKGFFYRLERGDVN